MENNSDRMGFALIALSVVAFVLLAVNSTLQPTVKGFFNGFHCWETAAAYDINESIDTIHTAYANSADGKNGFTTKPNFNLLDGTKDFSGTWTNSTDWVNDGTYKGLTVKKRTGRGFGIYKTFTAPHSGVYTFSAYIKSSESTADVYRYVGVNGKLNKVVPIKLIGKSFDWMRDSFTVTLNAGDVVTSGYSRSGAGVDPILWVAGYKWGHGSTDNLYLPSASETTLADQPKYIGTYTDHNKSASQDPTKYTWELNPYYHE